MLFGQYHRPMIDCGMFTSENSPNVVNDDEGEVDNSACPEIKVNISMSLTVPKDAPKAVPALMSFGCTPFEPSPFYFGGRGGRGRPRPASRDDKLIAAEWGCANLNPTTVQDGAVDFQDNRLGGNANADTTPIGAGLTRGIIRLANLGQPRRPDDWGALRAWGWSAIGDNDLAFERRADVLSIFVGNRL